MLLLFGPEKYRTDLESAVAFLAARSIDHTHISLI